MYLTRSEYDRGVNTFSPEGRLFQVSRLENVVVFACIGYAFLFVLFFVRIPIPMCEDLSWPHPCRRFQILQQNVTKQRQVEYAIEAIKLGSTAVGIQTQEGCVLAVEKRLTSPLLDPASVEKIAEIDAHIGAAMSGLVADAKTLVDHARVEAQNHSFTYDEPIGVEPLTQGAFLILAAGAGPAYRQNLHSHLASLSHFHSSFILVEYSCL